MGHNGLTAEEVIAGVEGSRGFITVVASRLGISRNHVYRLAKKYTSVAAAIKTEREKNKDFAEGKLMEGIQSGNMTAIIFYLKTQAKDRGYVERQEVTGRDGEDLIRPVVFLPKVAQNGSVPEDTS